MLTDEELRSLNARISANADKLIDMGVKVWYKTRRRHKPTKSVEDQLREIEDSKVEDKK